MVGPAASAARPRCRMPSQACIPVHSACVQGIAKWRHCSISGRNPTIAAADRLGSNGSEAKLAYIEGSKRIVPRIEGTRGVCRPGAPSSRSARNRLSVAHDSHSRATRRAPPTPPAAFPTRRPRASGAARGASTTSSASSPTRPGVARGKLMPTREILRRQSDDAARLDVHPDHHRRISGGGGGFHRGPDRQRPDLPPGFRHARRRALGERSDRAGDPRRLPQGRHALRDRAAQRAEAHRAALRRPRLAAGRRAGDGVLSRQAEHRSRTIRWSRRSAAPAGRSAPARPIRSPRSTSSRSCSTTSTASPRRRGWRSTR